jgi:hypothetical protein
VAIALVIGAAFAAAFHFIRGESFSAYRMPSYPGIGINLRVSAGCLRPPCDWREEDAGCWLGTEAESRRVAVEPHLNKRTNQQTNGHAIQLRPFVRAAAPCLVVISVLILRRFGRPVQDRRDPVCYAGYILSLVRYNRPTFALERPLS